MRQMGLALLALVVTVAVPIVVTAQEPQSPAKEHQELKALEGKWDAVMKMADGSETKGTADYKLICEGMWLQSDFFMDFGGQKFHGHGLDGYDIQKKQFVSIWTDSMTSSPMTLHGTKEGKVLTMTGEGSGPAGETKYRNVTVFESADKMIFTMSIDGAKDAPPIMTVTYTRKK